MSEDKDLTAFESMMKLLDILYMLKAISHETWYTAHADKWDHVRLKSKL